MQLRQVYCVTSHRCVPKLEVLFGYPTNKDHGILGAPYFMKAQVTVASSIENQALEQGEVVDTWMLIPTWVVVKSMTPF